MRVRKEPEAAPFLYDIHFPIAYLLCGGPHLGLGPRVQIKQEKVPDILQLPT